MHARRVIVILGLRTGPDDGRASPGSSILPPPRRAPWYGRVVFTAALLLVHLVSFAAYLGAGFAQTQLMNRSRKEGIPDEVRADRERLAAAVAAKIELPAIMGSVVSGIGFVVQNPAVMKFGWLHAKLLCVLLLLLLSHAEMFNARRIVTLRAAGGDGARDEIAVRKKRHDVMGRIGALLVVAILVLVTFVRLS